MNSRSCIFLTLITCTFIFRANDIPLPAQTHQAYLVMIEAGAKLLEFDVVREELNAQQHQLVIATDKEKFYSSAGKAISLMWPIEMIASSFDEAIPAFINLNRAISEVKELEREKIAKALKGLMLLLNTPEVLHMVMPLPHQLENGYLDAMKLQPIVDFIKTVRDIVQKKYSECSCDTTVVAQSIKSEARFFYDIIKTTVSNMFGHLLTKQESSRHDIDTVKNRQPADGQKETSLSSKKRCSAQDQLYRGIINDLSEEIKQAIDAGANIHQFTNLYYVKNSLTPLDLATMLVRPNSVQVLLDHGAKPNSQVPSASLFNEVTVNIQQSLDLLTYSILHGDFKTGLRLINHGAALNITEKMSHTFIEAAIEYFDQDIETISEFITVLINRGLNVYDPEIWYTLLQSRKDCPEEIIKLFISNGANPNAKSKSKQTPLLLAVNSNKLRSARALLNAGALVNEPLQCINGNPTLLSYEIDRYSTFKQPAMLDIIKLLKEHGAQE